MNQTVLVVAAHPDDEILGCGGTMVRHAQAGDSVHVVIMAEGVTSRSPARDLDTHQHQLRHLADIAREANRLLGAASVTLHGLPDNRMDSVDRLDVTKLVEAELARLRPAIVYTHHVGDLNIDHRVVHDSVVTACRPLPNSCVRTLAFFEVPSSTEWQLPTSGAVFAPNWFIDISETLAIKLEALRVYRDEMRPWPHPRSPEAVEHLARWRGATSGIQAAEAFMLGRHLAAAAPSRQP